MVTTNELHEWLLKYGAIQFYDLALWAQDEGFYVWWKTTPGPVRIVW
jgi:hypothetical protein